LVAIRPRCDTPVSRYFACYDVFMLLAVLGDLWAADAPATKRRLLRDVCGLLGAVAAPLVVARHLGLVGDVFPNLGPLLEWANAIVIIVVICADTKTTELGAPRVLAEANSFGLSSTRVEVTSSK